MSPASLPTVSLQSFYFSVTWKEVAVLLVLLLQNCEDKGYGFKSALPKPKTLHLKIWGLESCLHCLNYWVHQSAFEYGVCMDQYSPYEKLKLRIKKNTIMSIQLCQYNTSRKQPIMLIQVMYFCWKVAVLSIAKHVLVRTVLFHIFASCINVWL